MNMQAADPAPKKRRIRILRILGIGAIVLTALIAAAPWIVAKSGLRDRAINGILASPSVSASSDNASFGWFSPLSVEGLQLHSSNDRLQVRVQQITAERTPWQLWKSSPDLGTIDLDGPHVYLQLPLDVQVEESNRLEPTFKAVVRNGGLTVRVPEIEEPVIDVDNIDFNFRVEESDNGRVLTLDPVVLLNRRKLSPQLGQKFLHLVDPALHDAPQISGEVSLSLEKFRVPLGIPRDQMANRVEIEGKLGLHQVCTEARTPLSHTLVQMLADMHGKQAHEVVRIVQDGEIHFEVRDGRLHHEGLCLGFPDIDPELVIRSHGSVGLDHTLDLYLDLPRLDMATRKELGSAKCHITGTIREPKVAVQDASLVVRLPGHKDPLIDVHGINLNMQVQQSDSGRVLVVEPLEIFKREKVSPELASGLLHLLEPDLASNPRITGAFSLSLSRLHIPLGLAPEQTLKRIKVEGKLGLHQIVSEVKSPINQALVQMLADRHGKQPSDVLRLVEDADIDFEIRDGRLFYRDLRIGVPDIDPALVVTSRGSIGLDQTLDLYLDLPRLDTATRKKKGPSRCHVTGTIRDPRLVIEDASLVVRAPNRPQPILDVDGINLTMQVKETETGRILAVEPCAILRREKLSLELASGLVHVIEPELLGNSNVKGEVSLTLDKLQIPLGVNREQFIQQAEIEGKLTLHQMTTDAKNPLRRALIHFLSDLHGKHPCDVVCVVQDAEIRFRVLKGRVFYEGLRFGLPEIGPDLVVTSRGSVGLDDTLDLDLELPRLREKMREPVQCRITGPLTSPRVLLKDTSLVVNLTGNAKPALQVSKVNLSFNVEQTKSGPVLTLAPVTLFDKVKFTPEVGDEILRLIAPTLTDVTDVQGQISLSLEKFRVPLSVPKDRFFREIQLAGKLRLHSLSATAKTPLLSATVKVLADLHGKKPTDVVRVAHNDEIKFEVREGRVYHEGLRIGFPDISPDLLVRSRGWVGVDRSLDLVLEIPRIALDPDQPKTKAPVRLRVTGTIAKPTVTEIKEETDQ